MMRIDGVNRMYDMYSKQMETKVKVSDTTQSRDEVNLSNQAKDFIAIKKMLEKEEQVECTREARVQEIKEKMNNGTYAVTAEQVASQILLKMKFRD